MKWLVPIAFLLLGACVSDVPDATEEKLNSIDKNLENIRLNTAKLSCLVSLQRYIPDLHEAYCNSIGSRVPCGATHAQVSDYIEAIVTYCAQSRLAQRTIDFAIEKGAKL